MRVTAVRGDRDVDDVGAIVADGVQAELTAPQYLGSAESVDGWDDRETS